MDGKNVEWQGWRDGHFYSPIPSSEDIDRAVKWSRQGLPIPGVRLLPEDLFRRAEALGNALGDYEPGRTGSDFLFKLDQSTQFNRADAVVLAAYIADLRPRRVVEIGSGFSTAVILDAREHFGLDFNVQCIEPNPDRLLSILNGAQPKDFMLVQSLVQDLEPASLASLQRDDLLFIDSSHVAKAGSDVVFELLEVVPRLPSGVVVHVHDIFRRFEYPEDWFLDHKLFWSEAYLLRALLIHNSRLAIEFWPGALDGEELTQLFECMPQLRAELGGSLYLRTGSGD